MGPVSTMLLLFILGFFLEWIEIYYIVLPLFFPICQSRRRPGLAGDFCHHQPTDVVLDPALWLSTIFLNGVTPPGVTTADIYKSVIPFFGVQVAMVAILFYYPELATWLLKAIRW